MPRVRLALICSDFILDPESNIYSLSDVFEDLTVPELPVEIRFYVIVYWGISAGEELDQSLTLVNAGGDILVSKRPLRVAAHEEHHITFTEFSEVILDVPSAFTVNIHADGIAVDKVSFVLREG